MAAAGRNAGLSSSCYDRQRSSSGASADKPFAPTGVPARWRFSNF